MFQFSYKTTMPDPVKGFADITKYSSKFLGKPRLEWRNYMIIKMKVMDVLKIAFLKVFPTELISDIGL